MFTDDQAIPTRVETLLDLLRSPSKRKWTESQVAELLQPASLPGVNERSKQAAAMVRAATELGLVERGKEHLRLTFPADDPRDSRAVLTEALDERVLGSSDIEPYFAPFYSFLLSLGRKADDDRGRDAWVTAFRDAYPAAKGANPFNETKLSGLHGWFGYAGLGWYDTRGTTGVFQCDPYERLRRRLPQIFGKDAELAASDFFAQVATACPELDGGEIFRSAATGYTPGARRCSLGLSRALVELHQDQILRLSCPTDSDGWWIEDADPPRDSVHIQSDRIDRVAWLVKPVTRAGRKS
jgi:hypothetical protein